MGLFGRFRHRKAPTASGESRKLSLQKRVAFILLANLIAFCVLALLGEVGCRMFTPQVKYGTLPDWMLGDMLRFSADIYLGWELQPDRLDHNSAGTRGGEVAREKAQGVRRIAMIGDSVTYGLGVQAEEAFPSLLESKLRHPGRGPVEVLNFGVPGYSTFQEYTQLKNRGLSFSPDLVVMTFTPDDVETSPVIINVGGKQALFRNQFERSGLFNNPAHWALFRNSHFYRLLYKSAALACVGREQNFDSVFVQPEVGWKNVCRTNELCKEHGVEFLLVISPYLLPYVTEEDREEMQRYEKTLDRIREFVARDGLALLDLGPLYDRHVGRLKLKPEDYEHLNPAGHELVAEALFERIGALGLER